MRVYTFARQLGVPASAVIDLAQRLRLNVLNPLSSLTAEQQAAIESQWRQFVVGLPDPDGYRRALLRAEAERRAQVPVPTGWLLARTTVGEVEHGQLADLRQFVAGPAAQGFDRVQWQALKGMMAEGDELWTFRSLPSAWKNRGGRAGVALVRAGQVVGSLVTLFY
jgi:hypothetical protein